MPRLMLPGVQLCFLTLENLATGLLLPAQRRDCALCSRHLRFVLPLLLLPLILLALFCSSISTSSPFAVSCLFFASSSLLTDYMLGLDQPGTDLQELEGIREGTRVQRQSEEAIVSSLEALQSDARVSPVHVRRMRGRCGGGGEGSWLLKKMSAPSSSLPSPSPLQLVVPRRVRDRPWSFFLRKRPRK